MQQHVIQKKDQAHYILQVGKNSNCGRWFTLNSSYEIEIELPSGAMRYTYCILPASNMTLSALLAVLLKLSTACLRVMFGLDENSF
ncbi:hypothetical protein [Nitrosomonas communis]|uniref:hypothetical protein n=1 Tax=Nitrosomonas communis TaxID=44574 RepID=UPI003D2B4580